MPEVTAVISQMATGTISFIGSVVSNLWVYFLSLAVLAFAIYYIRSKAT